MYVYKIGYYSHEESDYVYLTHKEKFSSKQLREFVEKASLEAVALMKSKDDYLHNYEDIHPEVINILTEKYGFSELKLTSGWICFGWGSIFVQSDWKESRDKNLKSLTKTLNKAGYDRKDDTSLSEEWKKQVE